MAAQPIGPQPANQTGQRYATSSTCNRSYQLAAVRAGVIALTLLAVLAFIVLT